MKPNLFHEWLLWLRELEGTYEPMRDLDERRPLTGRRNPDLKPRQYEIGEQYAIKPSGQVVRVD